MPMIPQYLFLFISFLLIIPTHLLHVPNNYPNPSSLQPQLNSPSLYDSSPQSQHQPQTQSFKQKQCSVVINNVDLSTKVEGKIIGYKGSTHDRQAMMTKTILKVLKDSGEVRIEMVMVPIGEGGEVSEEVNCQSSFKVEKPFDGERREGEVEGEGEANMRAITGGGSFN